MHRANGLFDRDVISQSSGEKLAKVRDLVFDEAGRNLVAMLVAGSMPFSSTLVVRWETVVSVGDVIVVASEDLPKLADEQEIDVLHRRGHRVTGTNIVTQEGEKVGDVADLFVDDRGMLVGYEVKQGMLSGNKYLPVEKVISAGKDAIIAVDDDLTSVKDAERRSG